MALEAPYKGRDNAPAPADKAQADLADKPDVTGRDEAMELTATRHDAPQDEPEAEEVTDEKEAPEEEIQPEVPDAAAVLRHADYTRKTQALAEERRRLEQREADLNGRLSVYEQVDNLLAQNPALAKTHTVEQLVALIQSPNAPAVPSSLPPEVKKELTELRAEQREFKEELFADKVQASMGRLQKEYGLSESQVKSVVEFAVAQGELDYTTPPAKIHFKLDLIANKIAAQTAVRNGQRKVVQQLKEKGRAASGGASSSATAAETNTPRVKGWDNLVAKFQAEAKARRSG